MTKMLIADLKDLASRLAEAFTQEDAKTYIDRLSRVPKESYESLFFTASVNGETVTISKIRLAGSKLFYDVAPIKGDRQARTFNFSDFPHFSALIAHNVAETIVAWDIHNEKKLEKEKKTWAVNTLLDNDKTRSKNDKT